MTREEARIKLIEIRAQLEVILSMYGLEISDVFDIAIKALEMVKEFEKAQIITGGRLNGRTYAYKCGLEDGKRKALEQEPCEDCISRKAVLNLAEWFELNQQHFTVENLIDEVENMPSIQPINQNIKALGEELRTFRGGIKDEKVLTGFNMAVALCNKHLAEKE